MRTFGDKDGDGFLEYERRCAPEFQGTPEKAGTLKQQTRPVAHRQPGWHKKQATLVRPTLPDFLNEVRIINLQVGDTSLDIDVMRQRDGVG
jgi:hypothetical protein